MTARRRALLLLIAAAAALPSVASIARAQDYPARPVRLVVGFAAGGTQDVIARLIGQALSERLGQQIVVENRAGASSNIAAEAVIRSAPDGYTLFMVGPNNAINASLYDKLPFDFVRDTAPIAGVMQRSQCHGSASIGAGEDRSPSSSPMPRPIPARSTWCRAAPAPPCMSPASCSR